MLRVLTKHRCVAAGALIVFAAAVMTLAASLALGPNIRLHTDTQLRPKLKTENHRARIGAALTTLLHRPERFAYVVVREGKSRRLVQFTRLSSSDLLLWVPLDALEPSELRVAEQFFRKAGGARMYHGEHLEGYDISLSDPDRATTVALEIFQDVFALSPDFDLVVIEEPQ